MRGEAGIVWAERAVDLAALATGAALWVAAPSARVATTRPHRNVVFWSRAQRERR